MIAHLEGGTYSRLMRETDAFLTVSLDLREPVEVIDFARLFASLSIQFDEYVAQHHPEVSGHAKIYIKEVRKGSIIADLIPALGQIIGAMDGVLIVSGFAALMSKRVRAYIGGHAISGLKKAGLEHVTDMVKAVAKDSGGTAKIESVTFEEGLLKRKLEISFDSGEARAAVEALEAHKRELDQIDRADFERKLMIFAQSNIKSPAPGKRTTERVVISAVSPKDLPLIYASSLVEQRIKHEILEADDNIYKKGFVVDVNVESRNGKPVAYSVTGVHNVIDLPD